MMGYQPDDHFWLVGGDVSRVYSSARKSYLSASDSSYVEWCVNSGFGAGSQIDTEANLWELLRAQAPSCLPDQRHAAELISYAADARWRRETGGIGVGGLTVATDDRSKLMIVGARANAMSDPSFTTQWKVGDGTFVTIDATTIFAISNAVAAHVADCFAKEAEVVAAINGGTITTVPQIDQAFA